jgi:formylglycine-generating enzyme required for sulfatase activity
VRRIDLILVAVALAASAPGADRGAGRIQPSGADPAAGPADRPDAASGPMARIPAGTYIPPFTGKEGSIRQAVPPFLLDRRPVTTAEYLAFVRRNPAWGRSRAKRIFADSAYLAGWSGDDAPPPGSLDRPATRVSWFAAKAYCADAGKRLPTTAEWERTVKEIPPGEDSAGYAARILEWYSRPAGRDAADAPAGARNAFGVRDLFGSVWEWTSDFNVSGPVGRGETSAADASFFCGGAAGSAAPGTDYATFMRFAYRSSLKPEFALAGLGFRCAGDLP